MVLDWMMLNGINMALAMTGQEYVVREFYKNQGLSREDVDDFLAAPGFMPWQRMGNIQGAWALQENITFNHDWIDSQWVLQGRYVIHCKNRLLWMSMHTLYYDN
jgi:alpha-N-acetylglucosaminidase